MLKNKWSIIGITLLIIIPLSFGLKTCSNSNKSTKTGSSNNNTFSITAPSNLIAAAISPYQINLSWQDNSNNDDGFEIWRKVDIDGNYILIASVNSNINSYSDTGVYPGNSYYYRVRAFNTIGDLSSYSNEMSVSSSGVVAIAAGDSHSLVLDADLRIWSWGSNGVGQLGLGDTVDRVMPNRIDSDFDWYAFNGINYIATGLSHSIALKTDGTLWSWGTNGRGQLGTGDTSGLDTYAPEQVDNNSDWSTISVGSIHTVAIKTNRTIYSWGGNSYGELGIEGVDRYTPTQIGTDSDWASLVSGPYHTLARKTNLSGSGTIWGWGHNFYGQLGDGTVYTLRNTPIQIGTDSDWAIITAGGFQSFGIKSNYTLWACGNNQYGQLGLGDTANRTTITQIGTANDWSAITTGGYNLYGHTIALKTNRTVYSSGLNSYGQLGLGDTVNRNTLTQIGTDIDWSVVSAGGFHTIALKNNETIWVWGRNNYGQLGLIDTNNRYTPAQVRIGVPVTMLLLTANYFNPSQIVLSWSGNLDNIILFSVERKIGRNGAYVQIGTAGADSNSYTDVNVSPRITYYYRLCPYNAWGYGQYSNETWMVTGGDWTMFVGGSAHTAGLKDNGTLWVWGKNNCGQLGLGDTNNRFNPTMIGIDTDWSIISSGVDHTLALKTNKIILAWGFNNYGQLGSGDTDNKITPIQIGTESDWSIMAGGFYHSIACKTNGTLWTWGQNDYGQLGIGVSGNRFTPTRAGIDSDWSIIDAGFWHNAALKNNGTIWGWGLNNFYQLGLGYSNMAVISITQIGMDSDWVDITAGWKQTLARKTNGTIWAWGVNTNGQLGLGDIYDRISPTQIGTDSDWDDIITTGGHSIAHKNNGTIWAWGSNGTGQIGIGDNLINILTPTQIGIDSYWIIIASGNEHTMAIKENKSAWIWGDNQFGQLGLGDANDRLIPVIIPINTLNAPLYLTNTIISYSLVNLSWLDFSYDETGFKIERKTGVTDTYEQITTVGANTASCFDTVTPSTNYYYYRIRAYNNTGNSDYSNEISVTTVIINAPASLRTDYVSVSQLDLFWNDNSGNEDGFIIERKTNSDGTYAQLALAGNGATSYPDTALSADNAYYYRLKAYNAYGESNYSNEIIFTNTIGSWLAVSAGYEHTLGIKTNNTLWSWGRNLNGQLGLGDSGINKYTPTQIIIGSDTDWINVVGGYYHSLARKNNGTLWSWGKNDKAQLGLGDTDNKLSPAQIGNDSDWSSRIDTGDSHTIAIKTDNSLWLWGLNNYGQLGLGDSTVVAERTTPTRLGVDTNWSLIAAGRYHTIALKTNRTLWLWGYNQYGQLGLGDSGSPAANRNTPTQISSDTDWAEITAGFYHTIACKTNGTIYSWGNNIYGQLGLGDSGSPATDRNTPNQIIIGTDSDWILASSKRLHLLALKSNGTLWSWGYNNAGQLGLGDNGSPSTDRNTPAQILLANGLNWIYISAGSAHSIGIKENGTLWTWGAGVYGQLGLGDSANRNTPTMVGE
jgi:alpha-tubulin suppressor-like RCC1 family protein